MIDSAAIYVLHKDEYLPSAAAIRSGEGVNDNAKLHFEPGKTYKIRLINMSALASMSTATPSTQSRRCKDTRIQRANNQCSTLQ
jgi:hypothetical protein